MSKPVSRTIKVPIASALAIALLMTMLLGTFSLAAADEPADARSTTTDFYTRGTTWACTSDIACFFPEIVIRCKAGDYATGGAAWITEIPSGNIEDIPSRPWRKKSISRGWMVDDSGSVTPDDHIDVQVICARQA